MTDASEYGIGGYLCQIVNGKEIPIAFVSHSLTPVEKECYAIVYSLKKLLYLLGDRKFTVRTDHLNLTFQDTDAYKKGQAMEIEVQQYDIIFE